VASRRSRLGPHGAGKAGFFSARSAASREIQLAARLNHPNILPLSDSGDASGCMHFVMPVTRFAYSPPPVIESRPEIPAAVGDTVRSEGSLGFEMISATGSSVGREQ